MKLLLPAAPVLPPHHVGALISGRDSGRHCPRQASDPPPLPDILGRQVKKGPTKSAGPLTAGRAIQPPGDGVLGLPEACWEL